MWERSAFLPTSTRFVPLGTPATAYPMAAGALEVLVLVREDAPAEPWPGRGPGHVPTAGRAQVLHGAAHVQDGQRWRHRGKGGAQAIGHIGRMAQTPFHLVLGLHHQAPIAIEAIPRSRPGAARPGGIARGSVVILVVGLQTP